MADRTTRWVLVVSPRVELCEVLALALRDEAGYGVRCASSLAQADELIAKDEPDLVLIDIVCRNQCPPNCPQLQAAAAWRNQYPRLPAVLLAGDVHGANRELACSGFDRVHDKFVFELDDLLTDLAELMSKSG